MNKFKRLLVFLTALLIQETSKADTALEGFRAALGLGIGIIDSKVDLSRTLTPDAKDSSDISGRGAIGALIIDWGTLVGHSDVFMGVEASFNFITTKGKKSTNGTFINSPATADLSTSVFFRRAFDFVAKLGYMMKDIAVPYVKAGPSMGRWKANSFSNAVNGSGSSSENTLGVVLGMGADFVLTERVSFGVDYSFYRHKKLSHPFTCCGNVRIREVSIDPTSHALLLRINYKLSAVDFVTSPRDDKPRKRKRVRRPRPNARR